jgi:hypothetical protein
LLCIQAWLRRTPSLKIKRFKYARSLKMLQDGIQLQRNTNAV